ncbi:MAG: hypothetical protein L0Y58_08140 [Verrucomicrobia subdivision 3 bacterium]|nr:hypothetical protein [Limisphaerales bacterium]
MKTKLFLALVIARLTAPAADFVAHEWGTFTSVQGADGVQLEWNPFITADLPKFVYDRTRPNSAVPPFVFETKSSLVSLQRMETPVIYFYADKPTTVDVNVQFPNGIVTEWYPQRVVMTNGLRSPLRWDKVAIIPPGDAPHPAPLPNDKSKSHYYAARETDAAMLGVSLNDGKTEHEKFLFYRGIGSFQAPLRVTMDPNEASIHLHNTGEDELKHFFVLRVKGDRAGLARVNRLEPDKRESVNLIEPRQPLSEIRMDLARQMRAALESEGLYPREANAMVETWRDSWFDEQGVRVLYILPGAWTDRILPLLLKPRPKEIVRVMVGRAEVITPTTEWELMKQIVRHSQADPAAVVDFQNLGIGRFADAIVRRMLGRAPSPDFNRAAWGLLETGLRPASAQSELAAK